VAEERYKDATQLIDLWIETRAKGGNLLLNVGPNAYGEIPLRQESRLREMALWYMANHEAVDNIQPWKIPVEEGVWFTQNNDGTIIYAFVNDGDWKHMESRSFLLESIKGSNRTQVSVLGQNDLAMEYDISRTPKPKWKVTDDGLFVNIVKAQRLNKTWDNPLVIKIENAEYYDRK